MVPSNVIVGTIICKVDTIMCDIGTINIKFYLLEVPYPYEYYRITLYTMRRPILILKLYFSFPFLK